MVSKRLQVVIGTIILALYSSVYAEDEQSLNQGLNQSLVEEESSKGEEPDQELGYIIVEPTTAVRLDYQKKNLKLASYGDRRMQWGKLIGVSARKIKHDEFLSEYLNDEYDSIYGGDDSLGFEVHLVLKRNFSWYSLGAEMDIAQNKKKSEKSLIDSSLEAHQWKLGFYMAADNIFREMPYFAPYVAGGAYQVLFKERQQSLTKEGSTQVSMYGTLGLMFAMSWLDPISARDAYFDSGIENTYLFVEGTYFMGSNNEADPNFSGLSTNAGIKVEF